MMRSRHGSLICFSVLAKQTFSSPKVLFQVSTRQGLPVCECDPGFSGSECDQPVDPCISFCFNGGRCHYDDNMAPFCHCPSGFMGFIFMLTFLRKSTLLIDPVSWPVPFSCLTISFFSFR